MQNDGNQAIGSSELLARMAASIASGIEANPTIASLDCEDVAERAVSIAVAILDRVSSRSVS